MIWLIASARLISVSETEAGEALAEAKIKQMTGGDVPKGRSIKDAREFRCQCNTKLFVLLFSTKCTVERDRLDTAPDAVISVIDPRQTVSS